MHNCRTAAHNARWFADTCSAVAPKCTNRGKALLQMQVWLSHHHITQDCTGTLYKSEPVLQSTHCAAPHAGKQEHQAGNSRHILLHAYCLLHPPKPPPAFTHPRHTLRAHKCCMYCAWTALHSAVAPHFQQPLANDTHTRNTTTLTTARQHPTLIWASSLPTPTARAAEAPRHNLCINVSLQSCKDPTTSCGACPTMHSGILACCGTAHGRILAHNCLSASSQQHT
jgi:hypothetical protein